MPKRRLEDETWQDGDEDHAAATCPAPTAIPSQDAAAQSGEDRLSESESHFADTNPYTRRVLASVVSLGS